MVISKFSQKVYWSLIIVIMMIKKCHYKVCYIYICVCVCVCVCVRACDDLRITAGSKMFYFVTV
jgi:hypothetical protein